MMTAIVKNRITCLMLCYLLQLGDLSIKFVATQHADGSITLDQGVLIGVCCRKKYF